MAIRKSFSRYISLFCIITILMTFIVNNFETTNNHLTTNYPVEYAAIDFDDHANHHHEVPAGVANIPVDQDSIANQSGDEFITTNNGRRIYYVDSGDTLQDVVENLRDNDYETVCGFSYDGNKLLDCTSYQHSVVYTTKGQRAEFYDNGGTLVAHNHPSNSSFSGQDLYAEALYQTSCAMIISDSYIYIAKPAAESWDDPNAIKAYWQASYNYYVNYLSNFARNHSYNRQAILNSPDTPDDGSAEWYWRNEIKTCLCNGTAVKIRIGIWASHHTMLDLAEHFNIEYHRYPTKNFNVDDIEIFTPITPDISMTETIDPG